MWAGLGPLVLGRLAAQPVELRIYSEFQRVDPFGRIVAADKAARPREILSPAVARNGYASFRVVVRVPDGAPFWLYFGQNPEGTFKLTVYKERYARYGQAWIPDALERVPLEYQSTAPPQGPAIRGQTTTTFWLDAWVPTEARVARIRLDAQLNVGERWVIYPMEVRILAARIPSFAESAEPLPPVEAPADRSAVGPLGGFLCGPPERAAPGPPITVRHLIRRNAQQDAALARLLESKLRREAVTGGLLRAAGAADLKSWCEAPAHPPELGAEWYLRVRDYLLRTAP
ncbi:MAG: hypothetical protein AAB225_19800 [Acidobacteriota bacterium]